MSYHLFEVPKLVGGRAGIEAQVCGPPLVQLQDMHFPLTVQGPPPLSPAAALLNKLSSNGF